MLVNSAFNLVELNFALKSERIEVKLMENRMRQMPSSQSQQFSHPLDSQAMMASQQFSMQGDSQATIMNIETSNSLFI